MGPFWTYLTPDLVPVHVLLPEQGLPQLTDPLLDARHPEEEPLPHGVVSEDGYGPGPRRGTVWMGDELRVVRHPQRLGTPPHPFCSVGPSADPGTLSGSSGGGPRLGGGPLSLPLVVVPPGRDVPKNLHPRGRFSGPGPTLPSPSSVLLRGTPGVGYEW